jgi:hypothetical protein
VYLKDAQGNLSEMSMEGWMLSREYRLLLPSLVICGWEEVEVTRGL